MPPGGNGGSTPSPSSAAIRPQSGWWPTTTTVSPRPSTARAGRRPWRRSRAARRSPARRRSRGPSSSARLARAEQRARDRIASGSTPSAASRSPSSRAARRPSGVSARSSSGSPGAASRGGRGRGAPAQNTNPQAGPPGYARAMPTLRYVVADVFTDRPLEGNQLAVFTDARELDDELMQRLARELNFSETVFVLPRRRRRACAHPDLHADDRGALRGSSDARDRVRPRAPAAARRDQARDRGGHRARCGSSGTSRPDLVRAHVTAAADDRAVSRQARAARDARGRALGAAGRAVRQRHPARLRGARRRRTRSRRCGPTTARLVDCLPVDRPSTASPARARAGRRACSPPATACPRTRRPARLPGPLALHLARHGRIAFGDEIEISQGAEIGRPSTLYARRTAAPSRRGDRGRRQRRRRRARRVQASLGVTRDRLDLGEVEHERLPEAAAVASSARRGASPRRESSPGRPRRSRSRGPAGGHRRPRARFGPRRGRRRAAAGGRRGRRGSSQTPTQARTRGSETATSADG